MQTHWIAVLAALAVSGCAGKLAEVVREQAAQDLHCPASKVDVVDRRSDNVVRDFTVSGCGRTVHYQAACSRVDSCVAYQPHEVRDAPGSEMRGAGEAVQNTEIVTEVTIAADGTATVTESPPPVVAPPTTPLAVAEAVETAGPTASRMSVTLHNNCAQMIALFVGEQPGGAGRHMTLGSSNMITLRVTPGEKLWLIDRQQVGTAGVTIDASMQAVEAGCDSLSAR